MEKLQRQKCCTGCPLLDEALEGGFPCGSVIELVGESTAGKTQLALQLLVTVQFPIDLGGLNGSAVYIPTEGYYPARRLRQIAKTFQVSRGLGFDPCGNVFVEPLGSVQELFGFFDRFERVLGQQKDRPVRLLLIDSVAALFRTEFENNRAEMVIRARILFQLAGKLQKLAYKHDLAVVVTNQVMDCFDVSSGIQIGNMPELWSSGRRVAPALGLAWSHCINIRLFLSRTDEFSSERVSAEVAVKRQRLIHSEMQQQPARSLELNERSEFARIRKRTLHVVFAPHLPYKSCGFVVDENGVHGKPASV